jgi:hypothetical protein
MDRDDDTHREDQFSSSYETPIVTLNNRALNRKERSIDLKYCWLNVISKFMSKGILSTR